MERLLKDNILELSSLARERPRKALVLLREYQVEYGEDPNLLFNSGGILVDIGTTLRRVDLVEEGISKIEAILNEFDDDPTLLYNLANGYSSLCNLKRLSEGAEYSLDPDTTPLTKAKRYYRRALAIEEADSELRAQQWVNYGNCLSDLGRGVEAMSAYGRALELLPDHPMAKGNLGIELNRFAGLADHLALALDAQRLLAEALSDKRLGEYGGPAARRRFQCARQQVVEALDKLEVDEDLQKNQVSPIFSSEYERDYVEYCSRHGLFLNFCLHCRRCDNYAKDSVVFSLITDVDDQITFIRLSRVVNEIKERYAHARLLLFQGTHPLVDTIPFDSMTTYVDNLDYAVYGVRAASVKAAFESAYAILDKMAHFINDYLNLGVTYDPQVSFKTSGRIWREKGSKALRQEIVQMQNWHLFGLYDLARDLDLNYDDPERDGYWGRLRRTRNALAHEYVVLHVEGMHWADEADEPRLHLYYRDFVRQTIELLQLVGAAIIYLVAFIDQEERQKRQLSDGAVAPMIANRYDPGLFSPALNGWLD